MCDCISQVQEKLEETGKNTKLDIPITFSLTGKISASRVTVSTCKRDDKKREKPLPVFASYCPFCGERYESEEAVEQLRALDAARSYACDCDGENGLHTPDCNSCITPRQ